MIAVEGNQQIGFFKKRSHFIKIFFQKGIIFISLRVIKRKNGNIQIGRIVRINIGENIFSFNIKNNFFHGEKYIILSRS